MTKGGRSHEGEGHVRSATGAGVMQPQAKQCQEYPGDTEMGKTRERVFRVRALHRA